MAICQPNVFIATMHCSPRNVESSTTLSSNGLSATHPRGSGHKRQRSATFARFEKQPDDDHNTHSTSESCCTTSGESSGDESDESSVEELIDGEQDDDEEEEEEETVVATKRRRRADLDGLKKSVRRMEAQVVAASAQLKDLAAVVAQVAARRRLQQMHSCAAVDCIERRTVDMHLAQRFRRL